MFSKTDAFTEDEVQIAKSLTSDFKRRVILLSQNELEPFFIYERSKDRLNGKPYAVSLTDMADATARLWFQ